MYTLTLTSADRKAIDWIGHRYRHGDELYSLLWSECEQSPDDQDWDSDQPIRFDIPENVAWQIVEIIGEGLDCFSDDLRSRLWEFAAQVV
jgi:hypothetical protein